MYILKRAPLRLDASRSGADGIEDGVGLRPGLQIRKKNNATWNYCIFWGFFFSVFLFCILVNALTWPVSRPPAAQPCPRGVNLFRDGADRSRGVGDDLLRLRIGAADRFDGRGRRGDGLPGDPERCAQGLGAPGAHAAAATAVATARGAGTRLWALGVTVAMVVVQLVQFVPEIKVVGQPVGVVAGRRCEI
jgi:hypothetical protein